MKKPALSRMYEVFLHVVDVQPALLDEGCEKATSVAGPEGFDRAGALAVLRRVQNNVLPLVRELDWSAFLIHDRSGGVPVAEGDRGAYVHLRFTVPWWKHVSIPKPWFGLRKIPLVARGDREVWNWTVLGAQSELLLAVLSQCAALDDDALIQQVGQFLHYFANMTQLPHPWLCSVLDSG